MMAKTPKANAKANEEKNTLYVVTQRADGRVSIWRLRVLMGGGDFVLRRIAVRGNLEKGEKVKAGYKSVKGNGRLLFSKYGGLVVLKRKKAVGTSSSNPFRDYLKTSVIMGYFSSAKTGSLSGALKEAKAFAEEKYDKQTLMYPSEIGRSRVLGPFSSAWPKLIFLNIIDLTKSVRKEVKISQDFIESKWPDANY